MTPTTPLAVEQVDRDAAADIWRDYVARTGEIMVERQMRLGGLDEGLPTILARHRLNTRPSPPSDVAERLRAEIINTPETADFMAGVPLEAAHQRERWGAAHDAGKQPEDWFWLVGYLAGKALHAAKAGNTEKALHHTISTAAALANWHAALTGADTAMRPGIDPVERKVA